MHCLKFPFGCLLVLFSLGPTGAYGSEEKPLPPLSSSAAQYNMQFSNENSPGAGLTVVGPKDGEVPRKSLKRPHSSLEDPERVTEADKTQTVIFSEFTHSLPVVLLSPEDEKCNFSIPWYEDNDTKISVQRWDDDEEEYVKELLPDNELAPEITFSFDGGKKILNGQFNTSALNKSDSWMFRVMVTHSNPQDGFVVDFRAIVMDPKKVNGVKLLDGNAIGEDGLGKNGRGEEINKYKNTYASLQVNDVVILAADPTKPHFDSQLFGALVMTKRAVTEKSELLKRVTKPRPEEKNVEEQQRWDELVDKLTVFQQEVNAEDKAKKGVEEVDFWGGADLKKDFSFTRRNTPYVEGADDVLVDTDDYQLQLGPVNTTQETPQGIIIEPWGHEGGDAALRVWVKVYPLAGTLAPVMYRQHRLPSKKDAYKILWVHDAEQFAISHVVVMTPAVLSQPLTVIDLTRRGVKHASSSEEWLRALSAELEVSNSTVIAVGSTSDADHAREYFKNVPLVFFLDTDDARLTHLNIDIKKFTGSKHIYRRHDDSELFREEGLGLEETTFIPPVRVDIDKPRNEGKVYPIVQPADS
ncbi:hypothetical protein [Parendozoicomonas sp. Alg238-R29]|uniref:hypothetical protein n=1 Tax=Parendozoicomonas sp. Alg238-R29 TaxID=2993446 RepID=UPI00248E9278|nr:hypothetical protein [Parendozoicomonas sp. Alg238-R29]